MRARVRVATKLLAPRESKVILESESIDTFRAIAQNDFMTIESNNKNRGLGFCVSFNFVFPMIHFYALIRNKL